MNAKWREAVFVEVVFNEFSSKKGREFKTYNLNLKSFDGDDLSHRCFINVHEETGEVRLDRAFTQIIASKMKPKLLLALKDAIGGKDYDKKDEILDSLKEISLSLGEEASNDYREFAKKIGEKLEGHQFRVYWRGRGITTTNQTVRAGIANAQLVVFPIPTQKDHIKNKSLEDFLNVYREGSIEERNEEAVSALDGLDDDKMSSSKSILDSEPESNDDDEKEDTNYADSW